jgi:DNA-binding MarR family transcriptional regulator
MPGRTRGTNGRSTAVADALHSAAIHLLRRLRREDERAAISAAKLSALSVIVFGGATRLTDLARAEQVKAPTMTKLVAGMEREGLLRRRPDPEDGRAVRLEATPRGTRILREGRERRIHRLAAALRSMPPPDVQLLGEAAAVIEQLSRRL